MQHDNTAHYKEETYKLIKKANMQCGKPILSNLWKLKQGESQSHDRKESAKPHMTSMKRSDSKEYIMK
jgi:hypothetical protein